MEPTQRLQILAALCEVLLALMVAIFLTFVLTLPVLPEMIQVEFPLHLGDRATQRFTSAEVRERIEDLGLARSVELAERDGVEVLVLSGAGGPRRWSQVSRALEEAGYRAPRWPHLIFEPASVIDQQWYVLPVLLSVQAAVFTALGLYLARRRVRDRAGPSSGHLRAVGLGAAGGVAAFLASVLVGVVLEAAGISVEEQPWVRDLLAHRETLLRLAPWVVLIGPLSEEVFFRGYVFRVLRQHGGVPLAITVSSILFALVHLNLPGMPIYFAIGCVLAYVYERTSSLIAPVVGHVIVNATVLLLSGVSEPAFAAAASRWSGS